MTYKFHVDLVLIHTAHGVRYLLCELNVLDDDSVNIDSAHNSTF